MMGAITTLRSHFTGQTDSYPETRPVCIDAQAASAERGGPAPASDALDPEVWQELQRVMRGMDPSQLFDLVQPQAAGAAASEPPAGNTGAGAGPPMGGAYDQSSAGARGDGGVQGYEPQAGQLVLLLLARIDKQPAVGADMVQAEVEPSGRVSLSSPQLEGLGF